MAWICFGAIPIGALGVLMTTYLVRRAWTEGLHATLVAATSALPVVAALLLPVLLGMKDLYPRPRTPIHCRPSKFSILCRGSSCCVR